MARSQQKSGSSSRRRSSSGGRSSSQKPEDYRFAQHLGGDESAAEREYRGYAAQAREDPGGDPDVLLAVPVVKVDSIHLEVDDLEANVSLQAQVLELLDIDVGVEAHLGRVRVDIRGVEAQALLKVRLDHVTAIVDRVMTTLDRNPELVKSIDRAVEHIGAGAEETLGQTGAAAGEGAGRGVGGLGEEAEEGLAGIGDTAGQTVGQLAKGDGGALAETVGNVADMAGNLPGTARARTAAKSVAGAGSSVAGGAAGIGGAAARKVMEIAPVGGGGAEGGGHGDRALDATDAAKRTARELGVDLGEVEGTGANGRITVGDVRSAAGEGLSGMARHENQSGGRRRASQERPPDIEIGAAARAKRLRFEEKPDSEVRFKGKSIEEQSESDSVRRNLPDEVEPDVTYHDVEIGWRAEAWAEGEESSETPAAGEH